MAMLTPLWSAQDVIKVLGGTSAVARLTKSKPSAVSSWKRDGQSRIPSRHYPTIVEELARHGFHPAMELFNFSFRKSA
jgi:hypothetical protein